MKKTMVIGASHKPYRYSYLAVNALRSNGHNVIAVGRRAREVDDWEILDGKPDADGVHTVTLYLNANNQREYYDYILQLNPKRVIFNPGAENSELEKLLDKNDIEHEQSCTLVLLRTGQF